MKPAEEAVVQVVPEVAEIKVEDKPAEEATVEAPAKTEPQVDEQIAEPAKAEEAA